jgi:hypothetical protein
MFVTTYQCQFLHGLALMCAISAKAGSRLVCKPEDCGLYMGDGRELFTADSVEMSDRDLASKYPPDEVIA